MVEYLQFDRGLRVPLIDDEEELKNEPVVPPGMIEIRKTTVEGVDAILNVLQGKGVRGIQIEARKKDDIRIYFPDIA